MNRALVLLSPLVASEQTLDLNFLTAFGDALIDDTMDLQSCILMSLGPVGALKSFQDDMGHPKKQFDDLKEFFTGITPATKACEVLPDDVKENLSHLKNVTSLSDLRKHIEADFKGDKDDILDELDAAAKASGVDSGDYGLALGQVIHHLLIGKYPDEKSVVV